MARVRATGSPHRWSPNLLDVADADLRRACLEAAARCHQYGVAPILTLNHLATWTNVPYGFLRKVVSRRIDPYHRFKISKVQKQNRGIKIKAKNESRAIAVPDHRLLAVQRWLLDNVLGAVPLHSSAIAYRAGVGVRVAIGVHCNCRWLIKLDVSDFFGSITERHVYRVLSGLGYSKLVSFELARICTYMKEKEMVRYPLEDGTYKIRAYQPGALGVLPQGAPTSPALSNIFCRGLDVDICSIGAQYGLVYTRYADDIALSGMNISSRAIPDVIARVRESMIGHGLSLNASKISVAGPASRKIYLGLLLDGPTPRLSRRFRNRLEVHLHYIERIGLANAENVGFGSRLGYYRHILGLINYACDIQPEYGEKLRQRFARCSLAEIDT